MRFRRTAFTAATIAAVTIPVSVGAPMASAATPSVEQVTVTYNVSAAPSYASVIREGVSHWGALHNVRFSESSGGAMLNYHEGNFQQGSFYTGNGHGNGDIYIDNQQAQQYDQTRITAHETGHDLGLPDDYQGPCSELMSGGGPGPSCTNSYPNQQELAKADANFANGITDGARDRKIVIVGF
ncbi:snapalysin family zinc-dependent metalloprotease [Sciscionella marina]|uniref:snapalysin family zinc-dependent metalloprotease n=1 Tax=Sciscionella marina TaxID=508770 RepID=UPI00036A2766|nr:snapalysin family zinc-dependent metalloprotease [Sciscionella marina]